MHDFNRFWQWFADNNERLTMLNDLTDAEQQQLLDDLQRNLDDYCEGLTFEIGDPTPSGRTLTFSAEGDTDLFRYVIDLTDNAPDFDWWEVVPFKQPKGTDLKVTFDERTGYERLVSDRILCISVQYTDRHGGRRHCLH